MTHDHARPTNPAEEGLDATTALYAFTMLATELLVGRPPAIVAPEVSDRSDPLPTEQSRRRDAEQPTDRQYPGDPRAFAQALTRVVSALAHLGATAWADTATRATGTTPPRSAPAPDHRRPRRSPTERQRRRWIVTAAVTFALGAAISPRRPRPSAAHCCGRQRPR